MLKRTPCPPPVATTGDEPEEVKDTENKKAKTTKKKKKKTKKEDKDKDDKDDKGKNPPKAKNFGTYEPGKYMTVYKSFVQEQKVNGLSHKDALKKWHDSHEKWELLREMPEAEKKRRRFI